MTKEELKKRLKFIKATPQKKAIPPRDVLRRDPNKVANILEHDVGKFEDFFGFEEELAELEAARKQVERIESAKIKAENKRKLLEGETYDVVDGSEEEESFIIFEEPEEEGRSGNDSSFLILEEVVEEKDEGEKKEEEEEENGPKESMDEENKNEEVGGDYIKKVVKENSDIAPKESLKVIKVPEEKSYTKTKGFEFRYCKYIKSNNERCRRQAPKTSEYCGTHRKILAKQGV